MLVLIPHVTFPVAFTRIKRHFQRSRQIMLAILYYVFHCRERTFLYLSGISKIRKKLTLVIVKPGYHSQFTKRLHRPVKIKVLTDIFNVFRRKERKLLQFLTSSRVYIQRTCFKVTEHIKICLPIHSLHVFHFADLVQILLPFMLLLSTCQ